MEMHQSDRVLRQFGFRQLILVAPEMLDDKHKMDLRQLHTDWPRFHSAYIEMWENRYDYIPTREPIIVPELACVPEYMPWFRINGKPYLLFEEERRRQIRVQRERRGPLNPRRRDNDPGPSTMPIQSAGPSIAPTYPMAGWNAWLGSYPFPITPNQPPIYRPPLHEAPSGSSSFYQSPSPYRIQTPPPWVMQTPPQSLFYQGGSFSQHPQLDLQPDEPQSTPEQPEPSPEPEPRRNPARNRRRHLCGTDSIGTTIDFFNILV
ncbi:hypothetical protein PVK06_002146 [Gossypium arboreum]|uniref:Serine/threonine-protein phosphatase 7 long form homolog n=1 Tax=Gossypium arboreum TaxID=29729 RepID=A0ABR0R477_GOSAR|nr:hypothetical protein PVK06_002146 [Gossypium arboreum]